MFLYLGELVMLEHPSLLNYPDCFPVTISLDDFGFYLFNAIAMLHILFEATLIHRLPRMLNNRAITLDVVIDEVACVLEVVLCEVYADARVLI